jgi:hypothetical protein
MIASIANNLTIVQTLSTLFCVGRLPAPIHIPAKLKGFLTPMGVARFFLKFFLFWHIFSITLSRVAAIFLRS